MHSLRFIEHVSYSFSYTSETSQMFASYRLTKRASPNLVWSWTPKVKASHQWILEPLAQDEFSGTAFLRQMLESAWAELPFPIPLPEVGARGAEGYTAFSQSDTQARARSISSSFEDQPF